MHSQTVPAHPRVCLTGVAHHVTQRGNYRQDVFFSPEDRLLYLEYVSRAAREYGLELHGWCLMTNHVHWIVLPQSAHAMAHTFRRAHSRYAAHVNRKRGQKSGHLWQGRYYSCPLDEAHFGVALLYVERNPVRAGLVRSAVEYQWSSAAARLNQGLPPAYLKLDLWSRAFTKQEWSRLLDGAHCDTEDAILRTSTQQGKPFGSAAFVADLETKTRRNLQIRAVGRPVVGTPR